MYVRLLTPPLWHPRLEGVIQDGVVDWVEAVGLLLVRFIYTTLGILELGELAWVS